MEDDSIGVKFNQGLAEKNILENFQVAFIEENPLIKIPQSGICPAPCELRQYKSC